MASTPDGDAPLEIALALIFREGRVLITRRPAETHLGGLWEFPGGKRLSGEGTEACAEREALEEVGVTCTAERVLESITHAYPERTVRLHPVICRWKSGEPQPLEVAGWAWVAPDDLGQYDFPAANAALLRELSPAPAPSQLPNCSADSRIQRTNG